MTEPQKPSGSSTLWSFSASQIGWISAAALSHLALVSAAVETFLGQSGVRWWVLGAVALYIAAVIGVWRAAPSVWKRLTPTVLAASGVGLFLVLLAATAWLPGGQTEGIRLLGQTTPVLLAAVSAVAVALSGLALWRVRILPAWARYALAVLSLYGAVSFVIGLATVTPFAALFQGDSFWAVLPWWLQGAFVGGLLLIPLAIIAQIMRIVEQLRRKEPARGFMYQATALAVVFLLALGAVNLPGEPHSETGAIADQADSPQSETMETEKPVGTPGNETTETAIPADTPQSETLVAADPAETPSPGEASQSGVASTATAVLQEDGRQIYAAEVQALRDRLARLQSHLDGFPDALTDVSALAREYSTPEAAFKFVRDQIAFEPYPGLMKGARGTLVTRGGNALDRALLLAAVLRHNGISVRIAHARLADGQRRQLLEWIASTPGATGRVLATLDGVARPLPATPEQQQLIDSIAQRAGIAAKMVSDAVADNWPMLDAALQSKGLGSAAGAEHQALEALVDHYWVQAVVDNTTVDLDPSRAEAQPGQRLADAAASLDPDNLPDEVFQYIDFRVIADFLEGNDIRSAAVLSQEYKAADLFGKNIRLAIAPLTTAADESSIRAILRVGDQQVDGQSFQLTEKPAPANPPAKEPDTGGGGMFDAFSGGLDGGDDPAAESPGGGGTLTRLGRLSLEVISSGPHLAEASYRRVIMDRLDQSQAGAGSIDTLADDNSVRALMIQAWDGATSLGASHPVFVLQTALDTMIAQQSMAEKALANIYLGESFGVEDLAPPTLSRELMAFYLSSDVTRHLLSHRAASRVSWYYERPRLAFFRHGFVVSDWAQPHGTSRFAEGIDLLNSPFRFLGAPANVVRLAAESGVADTALEQSLPRDEVFNTLPLFTAAGSQGVPTLTIGPGDETLLQNVDVPPAIRRVLAEDLAKGQMLVLPSRLVTLNNVQTFGWWSVDPVSGFALGKMELGGAQGFVEVTKMNERIQEWNEIFTKFYGGMMKCYQGELQKNLGATEDGLRTLQLNKGSGPGDNPVPGSDTLAACVIKTMCDVIVDLMISAAAKPAFAREARATVADLEAAIMRWAMDEAVKYGTGKAKGAAAAACEAGANGG